MKKAVWKAVVFWGGFPPEMCAKWCWVPPFLCEVFIRNGGRAALWTLTAVGLGEVVDYAASDLRSRAKCECLVGLLHLLLQGLAFAAMAWDGGKLAGFSVLNSSVTRSDSCFIDHQICFVRFISMWVSWTLKQAGVKVPSEEQTSRAEVAMWLTFLLVIDRELPSKAWLLSAAPASSAWGFSLCSHPAVGWWQSCCQPLGGAAFFLSALGNLSLLSVLLSPGLLSPGLVTSESDNCLFWSLFLKESDDTVYKVHQKSWISWEVYLITLVTVAQLFQKFHIPQKCLRGCLKQCWITLCCSLGYGECTLSEWEKENNHDPFTMLDMHKAVSHFLFSVCFLLIINVLGLTLSA